MSINYDIYLTRKGVEQKVIYNDQGGRVQNPLINKKKDKWTVFLKLPLNSLS